MGAAWAASRPALPHVGEGTHGRELGHVVVPAGAGLGHGASWVALAFLFISPFLIPFLFLCYALDFYACIHVLPSMYTSLWGPLGIN